MLSSEKLVDDIALSCIAALKCGFPLGMDLRRSNILRLELPVSLGEDDDAYGFCKFLRAHGVKLHDTGIPSLANREDYASRCYRGDAFAIANFGLA